jgi:alkylhydroperoxidase/carboxymuconolactone decarboxylase family protein YurZ
MSKPPKFYLEMKERHGELIEAYESLSLAAKEAGPLDAKTAALSKLGLSVGAAMEGATHSSVRKALAAGCTPDEIRHVVLLGVTTLGFPSMMRARAWVEDVLSRAD